MPCRSVVGTVAVALLLGAIGAGSSDAQSTPKSYKNCKSLNTDYPHGVGRKNAKDKTKTGKPVTNFKVSSKIYAYNDGKARHPGEKDLDRDNDGVACEKH